MNRREGLLDGGVQLKPVPWASIPVSKEQWWGQGLDRRIGGFCFLVFVRRLWLQCFGGQETPGVYLLGEPRHKGLGPSWIHRPRGLLFIPPVWVFSVSRLFISASLQGRLVWVFCLAFTLVRASKTEIVFHTQARLQGEAVTSRWRMVLETAA